MEVQYSDRFFTAKELVHKCAGFVSVEGLHLIKISALDCLIRNDAVIRVMTTAETLRLITSGNDRNMIVINFVVELVDPGYLLHSPSMTASMICQLKVTISCVTCYHLTVELNQSGLFQS